MKRLIFCFLFFFTLYSSAFSQSPCYTCGVTYTLDVSTLTDYNENCIGERTMEDPTLWNVFVSTGFSSDNATTTYSPTGQVTTVGLVTNIVRNPRRPKTIQFTIPCNIATSSNQRLYLWVAPSHFERVCDYWFPPRMAINLCGYTAPCDISTNLVEDCVSGSHCIEITSGTSCPTKCFCVKITLANGETVYDIITVPSGTTARICYSKPIESYEANPVPCITTCGRKKSLEKGN